MNDLATPGSAQFFCPHCKTENPPYDFVLKSGVNLRMKVTYVTVVCGGMRFDGAAGEEYPCRKILSVNLLACEVTPGLVG